MSPSTIQSPATTKSRSAVGPPGRDGAVARMGWRCRPRCVLVFLLKCGGSSKAVPIRAPERVSPQSRLLPGNSNGIEISNRPTNSVHAGKAIAAASSPSLRVRRSIRRVATRSDCLPTPSRMQKGQSPVRVRPNSMRLAVALSVSGMRDHIFMISAVSLSYPLI